MQLTRIQRREHCTETGSLCYLGAAGRSRGQWALSKLGVSLATYHRLRNYLQRGAIVSVFLTALGPPPIPKKAMVVVAGCAHIDLHIFLPSMLIGRWLRYMIIGWIGRQYGDETLDLVSKHKAAIMLTGLVIMCMIIIVLIFSRHHLRPRNFHEHHLSDDDPLRDRSEDDVILVADNTDYLTDVS